MSPIEQLAELVGFHSSYSGVFGDQVIAQDQAIAKLLKAMGFKLDDKSLTKTIVLLTQKKWFNILPTVHIAKAEKQLHAITVSLPKTEISSLNWNIITELGDNISGTSNIDDLQLIDEIELDKKPYCQYQLLLPTLEQGYHQLSISMANVKASCPLIFAPKTCYSPQEASANKIWGFTAQLYSLRSHNNWGMGDFTDLFQLVQRSVEQRASTIGLNPLHPLFQQNPAHRSPYSPSSRCFLNPLYIDVTKAPNFDYCVSAQKKVKSKTFQQNIVKARASELIDYPAVAALKFEITEILFENFCDNSRGLYQSMSGDFKNYKEKQGNDLQRFATFHALNEHFNLTDNKVYGWPDWPKDFHEPSSDNVSKFQQTHARRIDYFCFLQWIANQQLTAVTQCALEQEMAIGLYLDLAVGCDGSGVDVWSDKAVYVAGASIGAPPDAMNPLGQNWGLTPINPIELQKKGYQPLAKALRSNMQYAGALRIDHILGLMRQYWVAPGMAADEGVYISFPFDDILRVIALESRRNRCVVIGEDLGNVPPDFSHTIQQAGLLSFKVMFFERWQSGLFKRPENFPVQSIITVSTHDTATLAGWWQGRDLEWREHLHLYPNEEAGNADRNARPVERQNLIAALNDLNVIDMSKVPQQLPALFTTELSIAVQKYMAISPSHLQLIPLEDALEIPEQVNIPGTINQHPNWLQKLPIMLEDIWQVNSVNKICQAMRELRPH
jgi:4-alpha-glucanotransferase